jgi:ubiquinone/menaquinone biosynthesis C-methylase UbiE
MQTQNKDFLWQHLKDLPYFRGFLRAVEARFYQDIFLTRPVLDLGCGDGHFASITFEEPLEVGLDPWNKPLKEALTSGAYKQLLQGSGAQMPFPDAAFKSVISNSVLEHIVGINEVLQDVNRVLTPRGLFVFCVPNHNFTRELSIAKLLDRFNLKSLAEAYRNWFNLISRHKHCDSPAVWEERMSKNGFEIERYWHYFSPKSLSILEWGHYFGLPSWISKMFLGRWILSPTRWNLGWLDTLLRDHYENEGETPNGCYTFYIARKKEI